jgi:hypothetical protein
VAEAVRRTSVDCPAAPAHAGGEILLRTSGQAYTGRSSPTSWCSRARTARSLFLDEIATIVDGFETGICGPPSTSRTR